VEIELAPYYNEFHSNGVTVLDLIKITKHILGIQPLDNPYKLIAGDVNNSGEITAAYLVEIQSLILQYSTEFAYNTS
jgi:hypothetical protein